MEAAQLFLLKIMDDDGGLFILYARLMSLQLCWANKASFSTSVDFIAIKNNFFEIYLFSMF